MKRTIGSCEIGRAEISTSGSGPTPAASRVQASLLSDTQDMYCRAFNKRRIPPHSNLGTYCVVESRFILKAINRVAPAASFVAILICLRYDGGCLLQDVTDESVQRRSIRIGDIHVVCCIVPEVPVVEWLEEGE